jgi:hypothetical protein
MALAVWGCSLRSFLCSKVLLYAFYLSKRIIICKCYTEAEITSRKARLILLINMYFSSFSPLWQQLAGALGIDRQTIVTWERSDDLPHNRTGILECAEHLYVNAEETSSLLQTARFGLLSPWHSFIAAIHASLIVGPLEDPHARSCALHDTTYSAGPARCCASKRSFRSFLARKRWVLMVPMGMMSLPAISSYVMS